MPGLGTMGGTAGGPPMNRGRKALVVLLVVLGAASAVALSWMSPGLRMPGPPPTPLHTFAAPDVLAIVTLREGAQLADGIQKSRAWQAVTAKNALGWLSDLQLLLGAYVPPIVRELQTFASMLLRRDSALYVYATPAGAEVELLSRAPAAPDLAPFKLQQEGEHRGLPVWTRALDAGRAVFITVRGAHLYAASTRARLVAFVDRADPSPAVASPAVASARFGDDPAQKALFAEVPPNPRASLYLDLPRLLQTSPWSALAPLFARASEVLLDVGPLLWTADAREEGVSFALAARVKKYGEVLASVRSLLGSPGVLPGVGTVPTSAVAFATARLSPTALRARFAPNAARLPFDPFGGVKGFLVSALQDTVDRAVENFTGDIVLGLVRGLLVPLPFGAAAVRDEKLAETTVAMLAKFVPGAVNELAKLLTTTAVRDVAGARLHTRELPVVGGVGYGVKGGWLFGGATSGAEGIAHALAGRGLALHSLARETFAASAHALGWFDATAATRLFAMFARGALNDTFARLGELTRTLVDAGGSLRLSDDAAVLRGFLHLRDLDPPK